MRTPIVRNVDLGRLNRSLDLELLIPAFNEEQRIESTLIALTRYLEGMDLAARVRVIDNGSSDRTADVVYGVIRRGLPVPVVISGCSHRGKGNAVVRGILTSTARWVGFTDADLATPPSAIDDAVKYLREGWPVVIGSRRCAGARQPEAQGPVRRVGGTGFRLLTKRMAGGISDTQCGFKFFSRSAAQTIFKQVGTPGFAFDLEVIALARAMRLPVKEFPVEWTDRAGSTLRPIHDGIETARDVWRLRRNQLGENVGVTP